MSDTETVPRLSSQELRQLFLFEALEDDQLAWLSEHGRVEQREQGKPVYSEGEPATCYFVLLSGTISMHRRVEDTDVEINPHQPGRRLRRRDPGLPPQRGPALSQHGAGRRPTAASG